MTVTALSPRPRPGRNAATIIASRFGGILRGLLTVPLLTRSLGIEEYGQFAAIFALVTLLRAPLAAGLSPPLTATILRHPERETSLVRSAVREALFVGLLLWLILLVCYPRDGRRWILACLGLCFVGDAFGLSRISLSARLLEHRAALCQTVGYGCMLAALLAIAALHLGTASVIICVALGALLEGLLLARAVGDLHPRASRTVPPFWRLFVVRLSAATIGTTLAVGLCMQFDVVLVRQLAGPVAAGGYAGVARVMSVWFFFSSGICNSLLPLFATDSWNAGIERCIRSTTFLVTLGIPIAVMAPLYGGAACAILGPAFVKYAPLACMLAWRVTFGFIVHPIDAFLIANGRQNSVLVCHALAAVIAVSGSIVLIPRFGAMGAAIAGVIAAGIKAVAVSSRIGSRPQRQIGFGMVVCLFVGLVAFGAARCLGGPALVQAIVAATLYVGIMETPWMRFASPLRGLMRFVQSGCAC